jgi:hypothetical protein
MGWVILGTLVGLGFGAIHGGVIWALIGAFAGAGLGVFANDEWVLQLLGYRRYSKITYIMGGHFITTDEDALQFISEAENPLDYTRTEVWMRRSKFEALPDFPGF